MIPITKNTIALARGFLVFEKGTETNPHEAFTVQINMLKGGYRFSDELLKCLETQSLSTLTKLNEDFLKFIQSEKGSSKATPLYPGFPDEVMEPEKVFKLKSSGYNQFSLKLEEGEKEILANTFHIQDITTRLDVIELGTEEQFKQIFTGLVAKNSPLTAGEEAIVKFFTDNYHANDLPMPEEVPFKETMAKLWSAGLDVPVRTATDVLRIIAHVSGIDPQLYKIPKHLLKTDIFKFKKFSRKDRKRLLHLLEKCPPSTEDMALHAERWKRVGEILHPGEYATAYPKAYKAFTAVREGEASSWYSKRDKAFQKGYMEGAYFTAKRPGEYARALHSLIRNAPSPKEKQKVVDVFDGIASKVSNKVLFSLLNYFNDRLYGRARKVKYKGSLVVQKLDEVTPINKSTLSNVIALVKKALRTKFKQLPDLGRCYIDPQLKHLPVPLDVRSDELTLQPVIRGEGTKLTKLDQAPILRVYTHWKGVDDGKTYDLDLSAIISYDGAHPLIGWNGSATFKKTAAVYSGDVRHRIGTCAEYIDLDIPKLKEEGVEYVILDVNDFTQQGFHNYQDAVFGVTQRATAQASTLWVPLTIQQSHPLNSDSSAMMFLIVDVQNEVYYNLNQPREGHTALSNIDQIKFIAQTFLDQQPLSVYELLNFHAYARGSRTKHPEKAEIFFTLDDFKRDYNKIFEFMGI